MLTGTATGKRISVLIVDDFPLVRETLRNALTHEPDIVIVGEATNGLEAEKWASELLPDVIIMDMFMPLRDGLKSMISIKLKLPAVKVLFLTVSDREENLFKAIRFGADGYLLKQGGLKDVADAVRRVIAGEAVLSPLITARVAQEVKRERAEPDLTPREREVLELLAQGLSSREIASRLSVAKGTVNTYANRLLQKLHLNNRDEAKLYLAGRLKNSEDS